MVSTSPESPRSHQEMESGEDTFRLLMNGAADAYLVIDSRGGFIYASQRACEVLGYSYEELLTLSVLDIAFDFDEFEEEFEAMVPGVPVTLPGYLRRKDGTTFPVEIQSSLIALDGHQGMFAVVRDIEERKRAEEALRESEEGYRPLYQNTPVMMHSIDLDGRLVSVNDHWLTVLGYERS